MALAPALICELVCLTWVLPAASERTRNYFNLTISSEACVCNFGCTWQRVICYEKADAMMRRASAQIYHELNHGAYDSIHPPSKPTCFYRELPRSISEILIKRGGFPSAATREIRQGLQNDEGLPTHRGWGPLHRELAWQVSLEGPSSL